MPDAVQGAVKRKRVRAAADAAQKRVDEVGAPGGAAPGAAPTGRAPGGVRGGGHARKPRGYAVLGRGSARATTMLVSETWGSEPWVAGELGGTTGVLEIVFGGTMAGAAPTRGLGGFRAGDARRSARCGLVVLAEKMRGRHFGRRRVPSRLGGGLRVETRRSRRARWNRASPRCGVAEARGDPQRAHSRRAWERRRRRNPARRVVSREKKKQKKRFSVARHIA